MKKWKQCYLQRYLRQHFLWHRTAWGPERRIVLAHSAVAVYQWIMVSDYTIFAADVWEACLRSFSSLNVQSINCKRRECVNICTLVCLASMFESVWGTREGYVCLPRVQLLRHFALPLWHSSQRPQTLWMKGMKINSVTEEGKYGKCISFSVTESVKVGIGHNVTVTSFCNKYNQP